MPRRLFPPRKSAGKLRLVASRDGRDGSISIHQDADLYAALLAPGEEVAHEVRAGRGAWVHVARGSVVVNGEAFAAGDGVAVSSPGVLRLEATGEAEVLVFDLAK